MYLNLKYKRIFLNMEQDIVLVMNKYFFVF